MIILGVDPGTILTGFGVIRFSNGTVSRIFSGVIKTPQTAEMPPRLAAIYDGLTLLIKKYKPDQLALETAFYGKNIQSALKIGYARGAAMLAAYHNNIPAFEYSPREVKKAVAGRGSATKEQVLYMVRKLLELEETKMKFDESDAIAVAVCHAFKSISTIKRSGSWKFFIAANPDKVISD